MANVSFVDPSSPDFTGALLGGQVPDPEAAARAYAIQLALQGQGQPGYAHPDIPLSGWQNTASDPRNPMAQRLLAAVPLGVGQVAGDLAKGIYSGVTAPGDILQGKLTQDDPRFAESAQTIAGLVAASGMPFAEEGALGAGGGLLKTAPLPGSAASAITPLAEDAGGQAMAKALIGYHGSPHDFDKFDLSKVGTGEGAQAYGHGMYFAEAEPVAQSYKNDLATNVIVNGRQINHNTPSVTGLEHLIYVYAGDMDKVVSSLEAESVQAAKYPNHPVYQDTAEKLERAKNLRDSGAVTSENTGHMYQVQINADPEHFLDWDKPLDEQHPIVQNVLKGIGYFGEGRSLSEGYRKLASDYGGADQASSILQNAGIPGIKYLDLGSRSSSDGTHNYVVFNPETVQILKKYGLAGVGLGTAGIAAGASNTSTPDK